MALIRMVEAGVGEEGLVGEGVIEVEEDSEAGLGEGEDTISGGERLIKFSCIMNGVGGRTLS